MQMKRCVSRVPYTGGIPTGSMNINRQGVGITFRFEVQRGLFENLIPSGKTSYKVTGAAAQKNRCHGRSSKAIVEKLMVLKSHGRNM